MTASIRTKKMKLIAFFAIVATATAQITLQLFSDSTCNDAIASLSELSGCGNKLQVPSNVLAVAGQITNVQSNQAIGFFGDENCQDILLSVNVNSCVLFSKDRKMQCAKISCS